MSPNLASPYIAAFPDYKLLSGFCITHPFPNPHLLDFLHRKLCCSHAMLVVLVELLQVIVVLLFKVTDTAPVGPPASGAGLLGGKVAHTMVVIAENGVNMVICMILD